VLFMAHDHAADRSGAVICGVAGGVGVTTIAAALGARDAEVYLGDGADVLVCRRTAHSLALAARALPDSVLPCPVLAVVHDRPSPVQRSASRLPITIHHYLQLVRARTVVIEVPFVEEWLTCPAPEHEAATLRAGDGRAPRHLRAFARSTAALAACLRSRDWISGDRSSARCATHQASGVQP
jgi:hypothetical protein